MSIFHSHGRQNLSIIARDGMMKGGQQQDEVHVDYDERNSSCDSNGRGNGGEDYIDGMDVDIFMYGPMALLDLFVMPLRRRKGEEFLKDVIYMVESRWPFIRRFLYCRIVLIS